MVTPTMSGSRLTVADECSAEVREILHAAASGEELTFKQGVVLATSKGSALEALVAVADHLRRKSKHQLHERVFRRMQFLRLWTRARCSRCVLALFRGSRAPRASGLGARRYRSLRSGRAAP